MYDVHYNNKKAYCLEDGKLIVEKRLRSIIGNDIKNIFNFKLFNKFKKAIKDDKRIIIKGKDYSYWNNNKGVVIIPNNDITNIAIDKEMFKGSYMDFLNKAV